LLALRESCSQLVQRITAALVPTNEPIAARTSAKAPDHAIADSAAPRDGRPAPEIAHDGVLGSVWGAIATGLALFYTAVLAPPAALLAAAGQVGAVSWVSRLWGRLILATCGVKLEIEGLERLPRAGSYVLVSNHQSMFDIFAILAHVPGEPRFVAKQELGRIPLIGFIMRRAGHVMIDRARGGSSIRRALDVARRGHPIVVFGEGHRFSDNRVHPFNDGAAWIGILTRLKCVPMAISGTAAFFPRRAKIVRPGRRMRIAIGEPIDTAGMRGADREALTRRLEDAVRALFHGGN